VKAIVQGDALEAAPPKPAGTAVVSDPAPTPATSDSERPAGVVSPPLPDPLPQQR